MTETLEQLRQDRDAYKQAYENMCVFYKQLVLANQRLAASHEAVEHRVQSDGALRAPTTEELDALTELGKLKRFA